MKKNNILIFLFAVLICLFAAGCQKSHSSEAYDKEIFALDTIIKLRLYGDNSQAAADLAQNRIIQLEQLLSVTDPGSEVSKINMNSGEKISVGDDVFNIIQTAENISSRSNGSLDISVYPIVRLWGFTTDKYTVPTKDEIEKELADVDYKKIRINEEDRTIQTAKNMEIDLGAIAKGYISEQTKNLLKQQGIDSAVLSFGGNIQTIGTKNGDPWKIGVKYPFTEDSFAILKEGETAVVTSATDQRYFEENGVMYHHIIDPKTGYPVDNGVLSATVVCDSGTLADALSTSLFVMGIDDAVELYKNSDDFEFIMIDKQNKVYVTQGLKDKFELTDLYKALNVEYVEK